MRPRRWPPILRDARYARPLDEAVGDPCGCRRIGGSAADVALVSRPSAERRSRTEREPGSSAKSAKRNIVVGCDRRAAPRSRVSLRSPGTRGPSGGRPVNNRELTGSGSWIARHCTRDRDTNDDGLRLPLPARSPAKSWNDSGRSAGIAAAQPQRPCAAARQRAAQPLTQICERAESAPDSGYSQLQNEATIGAEPAPVRHSIFAAQAAMAASASEMITL